MLFSANRLFPWFSRGSGFKAREADSLEEDIFRSAASGGLSGALDIGTCFIKAVECKNTERPEANWRSRISESFPLAREVISNGRVMDPPKVANAVKEALKRRPASRVGTVCACGVRGGEVIVRHVFFPRMPREELAQAVRMGKQARMLPYPAGGGKYRL